VRIIVLIITYKYMRNLLNFAFLLVFTLLFTSCFEVREEIKVNSNGSGNALLTINMSQSKDNLANYMKMGEVNGVELPTTAKVEAEITKIKEELAKMDGISNVKHTSDYDEFIFVISGDFSNVKALNKAINSLAKDANKSQYPTVIEDNYAFTPGQFSRLFAYKIDKTMYDKLGTMERFMLETAKMVGIYRFDKTVKSFSNKSAKLSPTKKAVMLETSIADIAKGVVTLENKIKF